MKRTLLTLFAALIATAMALPAQAQTDPCFEHGSGTAEDTAVIENGDATYTVYFCGSEYDSQDDQTTFFYEVRSEGDPELSHWTLELCAEALAAFVSGDPDDVETGLDGSTGVTGVKWNTTGGQFSFTLDGNFGEDPNGVVVKAGTFDNVGDGDTITGPSCEAELCTIETIPSWDGQVDTSQPLMAFIDLSTPNGFKSIEIMGGSENIVLVDADTDVAGSNPLASNFYVDAFGTLTFDGAGDAPTNVTVKFGPQTQAGSTFMFQVTDQFDCTLQVDPQIDMTVPETVELRGNYPNPFNPTTSIEFSLPEAMDVQLDVYDAMGRLVKSLVNDNLDAGVHNVSWNGTDVAGRQVASGAYFYRVQTGSLVQTKQMILLK